MGSSELNSDREIISLREESPNDIMHELNCKIISSYEKITGGRRNYRRTRKNKVLKQKHRKSYRRYKMS